jgi:hypothetical protein
MTRLGGAFWFILVVVTGMTNFIVKQTVQNLDDQLTAVQRKTIAEQREIHELSADWTFLNQPELLSDLNKRYLGLAPASAKQMVASIDSLPLRPVVASPDLAPQIAVASPPLAPAMPAATPNTAAQVAAMIPLEPAAQVAALPTPTAPPATATQSAEMIPLEPARQAAVPAAPRASAVPVPSPAPIVRVAAAGPAQPAVPASLDALFAQVSGDR